MPTAGAADGPRVLQTQPLRLTRHRQLLPGLTTMTTSSPPPSAVATFHHNYWRNRCAPCKPSEEQCCKRFIMR